jgi:5-methylcytosine-specific restriction enzyme A
VPTKAPRICAAGGCNALIATGKYCDPHRYAEQKALDTGRGHASARGYGRRWQSARLLWLRSEPFCAQCRKTGALVAATVVDHIRPHKGDMDVFWDQSNWQSMCKHCHDRKTATEDGGIGNRKLS